MAKVGLGDFKSALLGGSNTKSTGHSFGFGYVMVFPLPSETTDKDEEEFKKKHQSDDVSAKDVLLRAIPHTGFRNDPITCDIQCEDTLKSMRNATIELYYTFFKTLFAHHDEPGPRESKIFLFTSMDNDELFMALRMSDKVAEKIADQGEYALQLAAEALPEINIKLSDMDVTPAYIKLDDFMLKRGLIKLFENPDHPEIKCCLRQSDRVRLLYDKITDYMNLPEFQRLGLVLHAFPCHHATVIRGLQARWGNIKLFYTLSQPINEVRDYFGESVAFYFLWLEKLGRAQIAFLAAAIPLGVLASPFLKGTVSVALQKNCQFIYTICLMLWWACFTKYWKRIESYYANRWGMDINSDESEIKDPVNPSFVGEMKPSLLDENKLELRADERKQMIGRLSATAVLVIFLCCVIAGVLANQIKLDIAVKADPLSNMPTILAVVLSVQIKLFDLIWCNYLADPLTDMEQHVTALAYDQSKAKKTFFVKFINTFFAFFYIAFIKPMMFPDMCADHACQFLLSHNLMIIYVTYIGFGFYDMIYPLLAFKCAVRAEAREMRKKGLEDCPLSLLEQQAKMLEYTGQDAADDFMQVIFPVFFIILFSMLAPLYCNLLAIFAVCGQLRADSWKLCAAYRRTFPLGQDGIGVWGAIQDGFVDVCAIVNILLAMVFLDVTDYVPSFLTKHVMDQITECKKIGVEGDKIHEAACAQSYMFYMCYFFFCFLLFRIFRRCLDSFVPDISPALELEKRRQGLQRIRVFETAEQPDLEDKVEVFVRGKGTPKGVEETEFDKIKPLKPGDPMYCDPLVR